MEKYQLVFLIGAARSGTKILRTILEQSEKIGVIPYDMNYIWKYGHYDLGHDEINKICPKQAQIKFIKKFINKKANQLKTPIVIEKTVSNTLRVDYIKKIFPDAKFIHLIRDGRDVALSAKKRWEGTAFDTELQSKKDIIRKVLDIPLFAVMPYISKYIKINIKHMFSRNSDHVESWGPIVKGLDKYVKNYSLLEVCALQWKKSVDLACGSFKTLIMEKDYIELKYEDLLLKTDIEIDKVCTFLSINDKDKLKHFSSIKLKKQNLNKWKYIDNYELIRIEKLIKKTLIKLNYSPS